MRGKITLTLNPRPTFSYTGWQRWQDTTPPVESTAFAQPSMHYDVTRSDQSQASTQMASLSS